MKSKFPVHVLSLLVIILGIVPIAPSDDHLEGYKLYSVRPKTSAQTRYLRKLAEGTYFEFWEGVDSESGNVSVLVSPQEEKEFLAVMKSVGLEPEVMRPGRMHEMMAKKFNLEAANDSNEIL